VDVHRLTVDLQDDREAWFLRDVDRRHLHMLYELRGLRVGGRELDVWVKAKQLKRGD
jgi:hypothetical protein